MSTTRWLNETEQTAWRAWLEVMRLLPNHLEDRLHERHDLTLTDYQVLVEVSESAEHRLRMTELSHRTQLSKSRLSHQIGRMEKAGLVTRSQCPTDRRGQWAELTERGWSVLRALLRPARRGADQGPRPGAALRRRQAGQQPRHRLRQRPRRARRRAGARA
jgi:DNA-binding MarR family transcriptional regulator